jgi:UDPglucose--hexose-1-phosphate uridylyltransferase
VSVTELPDATLDSMIQAYRDRLSTLAAGGRWQYAQVFKNVGAAAGSSIEHAHSQLVALPYIPRRISTELERSACYYNRYGKHLLAELVEQELAAGERVVATTSDFIAVCPFASRFPYETWILPRRRQARFEAMAAGPAKEFARLLRDVIARLERTLGRPAYNYLLHTAPLDGSGDEHYHWHVELFPRITKAAGFEWATGYHINPVAPEQAAASLRAA